jgi:hypothetical protein
MTPENFFDPLTSKIVAIRTWPSGTSKYGYGDNIEEASKESEFEIFDESFGAPTLKVFEATDKIVKRGRYDWRVYNIVETI